MSESTRLRNLPHNKNYVVECLGYIAHDRHRRLRIINVIVLYRVIDNLIVILRS